MIELTDRTIDEFISADKALVLLSASWCGHCAAAMEDMRKFEAETDISCGWVNVQQNRKTLIEYFGRGIPDFLLFKKGHVVKRARGTGDLMDVFGDLIITPERR
jgi:thiol-disulfide isomerase/thioredoxin|uniref:TRX family protein n=1 Tax=Siphoviridae sp. ctnNB1 TaxID=2825660 RepID=A0A8S5UV71_9CAUD|nr:MAG TPA: TRX family protein [Siphoviridae sp. ctnNB1]